MSPAELLRAYTRRETRRLLAEMQIAKVARVVTSERQLEEVMVDLWENHFSVFPGKANGRYLLASYERDAIRPHALGRFRDLLGAVAKSPMMLVYLDNWRSSVDSAGPALAISHDRQGRRAGDVRRPRGLIV